MESLSLKSFFLPSEAVAEERRIATFGTPSKAVAGTAIVGTALVAGLAGPTGLARVGQKIGSKIATSFSNLGLIKQTAIVGGGLVLAGAISSNPKIAKDITKTPSALVNLGSNIGEFTKDPSLATAGTIAKENPVLTGLIGTGLVIGTGKGASALASLLNTSAIKQQTEAIKGSVSSSIPTINASPTKEAKVVPVTYSNYLPGNTTSNLPTEVTTTSYASRDVTTTRKKKKTQNLNTRPINIRNQILIANKNG